MASSASLLPVGKIEMQVHIKASPEQFYDILCNQTHHLSNVCPDIVKGVHIHEGEWGTEGSIISWNYVHAGKACVSRQRVEELDKENNKITFKVLGGDLLEEYKSFRFIMQIVPQKEGSVLHWIVEYEKLKDHIPDPHSLFHLSVEVLKGLDAHLNAAQNQIK